MFSILLRHVSVPRISDVMFHEHVCVVRVESYFTYAEPAIDMTDPSTISTEIESSMRKPSGRLPRNRDEACQGQTRKMLCV